jgi:flagellar biosynthesis/type III secretory pathway chaperone
MAVFTVTITDQTFDKKSAEVNYLVKVIDLIQQHLESRRGTQTGLQNVLGQNQAGVANSIVASYTYTASASNP